MHVLGSVKDEEFSRGGLTKSMMAMLAFSQIITYNMSMWCEMDFSLWTGLYCLSWFFHLDAWSHRTRYMSQEKCLAMLVDAVLVFFWQVWYIYMKWVTLYQEQATTDTANLIPLKLMYVHKNGIGGIHRIQKLSFMHLKIKMMHFSLLELYKSLILL